jgi:hypothetical protein
MRWGLLGTATRRLRAHQYGIILMMAVSTILAFPLPISIIARATAMFNEPLYLCFPAGIRYRCICKGTIDKSGSLQHDHRFNHMVPLDRILPCSRSKTPGNLPGNLR